MIKPNTSRCDKELAQYSFDRDAPTSVHALRDGKRIEPLDHELLHRRQMQPHRVFGSVGIARNDRLRDGAMLGIALLRAFRARLGAIALSRIRASLATRRSRS